MELDNIIKKVAGAYLASAVIAVIVLILTLGQPFVVFMGIGAMGLVTVLGDAIAQYGIEAVLNAFYAERSKKERVCAQGFRFIRVIRVIRVTIGFRFIRVIRVIL